jgi:hypothetical protein
MVILIESFIFSGQFKDSFASTGLNPELLTILTWVLTIAGSILILGILIQFIRKQFHPPKPVERLDDPRRIIDLLGQSLTERSRFEISFREKVLKTRGIFCTLVAVDKNELLLEVPEYATPRQAWIGRPLEAYFSLASRGNTKTYYTFESSVESIERQGSGTAYLHISLPKAISLGQRRMHFRLVPDPATILEVKVWFAQHQPRAKDHAGPARWGPPMAHHHLLTRKNTQASLKILDISAGGCRLAVTNNARINSYLDNNRSPDVFLFFRLLDRESGNLEIYLLGKIRVIVCDPVSNSRSLGIEFTMNGQTNNKSGQYITWTSLSREEGHPKMGNWIFKQHLALFRQQEKDKQEDGA